MKRKMLLLILALALVLGVTQIASAAGWGMAGGKSSGLWPGGGLALKSENCTFPAEKLNLSDEQVQKLKELQQNAYEASRDLRTKLQDAMFELKQLRLDKNPDSAAIDAKTREVKDLRAQIDQITQQCRQDMQNVLTPEQQSQLENMKGRGGRGGPGMRGEADVQPR